MKKIKKYTYDNWWNGEVTLLYAPCLYEESDEPIVITWDDIKATDIPKIKEKQKLIFEENVSIQLEKFKSVFLKRYEVSKMKKHYYTDEINECRVLMFAQIPNDKIIFSEHWHSWFDSAELSNIQNYIQRTIKNGIDDGFDFIHSPNCKHQNKAKIPSQIFAQFLWEYVEWLESLTITELDKPAQESTQEEVIKPTKEPKNDYPLIFKNGFAYQMFIELKNLSVKPKTVLADYGFIFHQMKRLKFIGNDVKHKTFIDILKNDFDADISAIKFPYKDQAAKNVIFTTLLDKYKPLIESVP